VIVATAELEQLRGRVVMVDGGFDPLHAGHVAYFRAAAELGDRVLCNVSPDEWIERKHPVLLRQHERAAIIDAIRWVDYTHPSAVPTVDVLAVLRPRVYAKGTDWADRLPEDERRICHAYGIEIVFLDTVLDSSTGILRRYREANERAAR
jgi:cytidyltransferase-like protein